MKQTRRQGGTGRPSDQHGGQRKPCNRRRALHDDLNVNGQEGGKANERHTGEHSDAVGRSDGPMTPQRKRHDRIGGSTLQAREGRRCNDSQSRRYRESPRVMITDFGERDQQRGDGYRE